MDTNRTRKKTYGYLNLNRIWGYGDKSGYFAKKGDLAINLVLDGNGMYISKRDNLVLSRNIVFPPKRQF